SYSILKALATSCGASLFGTGYIHDLRHKFEGLPLEQTEELPFGVSIGVRLSIPVLKGNIIGPTRHYLHHYRMVNMLLDQIALRITVEIQSMGYIAMPIPASQIVDWKNQTAHLSHKMVAVRAGLGWIGRNNLLVTKEFGSMVRLVSVLTNIPLKESEINSGGCGSCKKCISICPAYAIEEDYRDWDKIACLEKLKYFSKTFNIGQYICGLCVKVCDGS
ncbi:MAG: epoxyqueuosine reductase, partial [Nitrospirae bacterium]